MRLIRKSVGSLPIGLTSVATIGNFDGVHLGHRVVIAELKKLSKHHRLPALVITFEPAPREFFLGEKAPKRLMSFREKFTVLQSLGVDILCVLRFNVAMASLSAEDFIRTILVEDLGIKHLVVGDEFRFGKDRLGDIALLQREGLRYKFEVSIVPLFKRDGKEVSSTRVRAALKAGKVQEALSLLGRNSMGEIK